MRSHARVYLWDDDIPDDIQELECVCHQVRSSIPDERDAKVASDARCQVGARPACKLGRSFRSACRRAVSSQQKLAFPGWKSPRSAAGIGLEPLPSESTSTCTCTSGRRTSAATHAGLRAALRDGSASSLAELFERAPLAELAELTRSQLTDRLTDERP